MSNGENVDIPGLGGQAYLSHGSQWAIPSLLERLFFSGENIREGSRLSLIGSPNLEPFINAREVLRVEVWGILRSSFEKSDRDVIEKAFDNLIELIREISKKPENRTLKMDTQELYEQIRIKLIDIWDVLNDYIQGVKQFYVRMGESKDDLFSKDIEAMKKGLDG